MRIRDLLAAESIALQGHAKDKTDVLNQLVNLMDKSGKIRDVVTYREGVFAREEEGTTGIGEGIAIPHCKSDAVEKPGLAAMVVPEGVEYDALDGEPVRLLFLIAAPDTGDNVHLEVLSRLSVLLMDQAFTAQLIDAKSPEEFLDVIDRAESEREQSEGTDAGSRAQETSGAAGASQDKGGTLTGGEGTDSTHTVRILAVTACPTGIAHTYMAAEALQKKAAELGYSLKVETRGSGGAKNVLTQDEIAQADCIIAAVDTKVPMERFDGKKVIECKVADGIHRAKELLEEAAAGGGEVFRAGAGSAEAVSGGNRTDSGRRETGKTGSAGHAIYTHLMSGVSHMLPFVIGGGIMTALAFLIDTLLGYGATGGGDFGSCTPLSAFFKYVGGLSMGLMVPVLSGYIAYSIADRPGLAVGFTGGLLAASGNALAAGYDWTGNVTGFQKWISDFAFQNQGGGNTVSGFLGGIVAGFLAGYLVLFLKRLFRRLPESLDGIKPTLLYPLLGILLIGVLMCFLFNPIIGMINTGLGNMLTKLSSLGLITLLGLILGAMMAIDMGGPINKAAYVFGTGMLATAADLLAGGAAPGDPAVTACYIAMASIMAGGMVPPVGIALACWFFPGKFTETERSSKLSNLVMGCSFITEGAIPFAASDPAHVIPCTLAGAGVAGFLSALFGCTLMAPHGGIFVFATVGNPLLYIAAWLAGSGVTALLLGVVKRKAA